MTKPSQTLVGAEIRSTRAFLGLTQEGLGQRAGIPHHMISDFEIGYRIPSITWSKRLEAVLGLEPGTLVSLARMDIATRAAAKAAKAADRAVAKAVARWENRGAP